MTAAFKALSPDELMQLQAIVASSKAPPRPRLANVTGANVTGERDDDGSRRSFRRRYLRGEVDEASAAVDEVESRGGCRRGFVTWHNRTGRLQLGMELGNFPRKLSLLRDVALQPPPVSVGFVRCGPEVNPALAPRLSHGALGPAAALPASFPLSCPCSSLSRA